MLLGVEDKPCDGAESGNYSEVSGGPVVRGTLGYPLLSKKNILHPSP